MPIVAIAVIYERLAQHFARLKSTSAVAAGLLFGLFAVLGMLVPIRFAPGVIHDGRTIVVSVAGFVAGPVAGFVAAVAPVVYRISVGGVGAIAGVSATIAAALIGSLFYLIRRRNPRWESWPALFLMGASVHLVMITLQLTIPDGVGIALVRETGLVAFCAFTVTEALVARLLLNGERRQASAARLAQSERRYRELFQSASVPMLLLDPESQTIIDANAAAAEFYGYSLARLRAFILADLEAPGMSGDSLCHRLADGTIRAVEVVEGPGIANGERRLLLIVQDVTDRRAAERDLYLSRHCIRSASLDVIQIRETDARIIDANARACTSLGYSLDELKSMTVFDLDPTFTVENWRANRESLRRSGMVSFETVRQQKDGSIFPVEVTVTYLEYDGVEYNFSFAHDISKRNEALEQMKSSLEQKDTLLREVHHRVKNNLAVVSGLLSLQMDHVSTMDDAIAGLAKSKERVSAMAEIHSMLYEEKNFSAVDFGSYLRRLASALVAAYKKGSDVYIHFDLGTLSVDIDAAVPLALIANELIANAIKHAPQGGAIDVYLRLCRHKEGADLVVEDTGEGMPDGFDPATAGSLGWQLVTVLSGQISASLHTERRAPTGTRITVSFPLRPEPSELEAVEPGHKKGAPANDGSSRER